MLLPQSITGPMEYGYSNARVRGMKGLLLKKDAYDELLNLKSIGGMIEYLQRTHYKDFLLEAAIRYRSSLIIERACGKHFVQIAGKLRRIAPKSDKEVVDALLVKWDILNLKTVVLSKKFETDFSRVSPKLVPAGSLSENDLENIFNSDERDLFSEVRKTPFGKMLFSLSTQEISPEMLHMFRNAMKNLDSFNQLQAMIDGYSYYIMERSMEPFIGSRDVRNIFRVLKKEIDAKNVLVIERMKKHNISNKDEIMPYLLKGGTLSNTALETIISAESIKESAPVIRQAFPGFKMDEQKSAVSLEIEFDKALSAEKSKMFSRSILSVGVLLGFLLIKEEEMNNLRKIAKAKEFGIPPEEALKTLVVSG